MTAREIANVTGVEVTNSSLLSSTSSSMSETDCRLRTLFNNIKDHKEYHVVMLNRVFIHNNFKINKDFQKVIKNVFRAEVEKIHFEDPQKAANAINKWVKKESKNKFSEVVNVEMLKSDHTMVLVEAAYFRGKWEIPFRSALTCKENFRKDAEETVKIDMMKNTAFFNYAENSKIRAKFLEMFFEGGEASMVIVLPDDINGLADLEKKKSCMLLRPEFTQERICLSLPKFSYTNQLTLKTALTQMGITKAFTKEGDFSGVVSGGENVSIDEVVQCTSISVTEDGIEVMRASEMPVLASATRFQPKTIPFSVDHPFFFYIKHLEIVIFEGVVRNPSF